MSSDRKYVIKRAGTARPGTDFTRELNPAQHEAVTCGPGPVLCIAGAGTGKTRTVTYRVAWLIENGVPPGSIILCTFTNRAAREMLGRVQALTGAGDSVLGGTFHHIAGVFLRRNAELAGYRDNFGIIDDEDAAEIIAQLMPKAGFSSGGEGPPPNPALAHGILGLAANMRIPIGEVVLGRYSWLHRYTAAMERLGALFEGRLRELNVTDFDGLLVNFERLLSGNPEAARALTSRFSHVLVDEYQDTTRLQSDIVELLAPTELHSLMVVGDDAQAIYSFRGARIENMLGFPERHPGCRIVRLTRNYRSSPQILNLANRVLSANRRQFRKDLETLRPPGPLPVHLQPRDGGEQAEFVAQRIGELAGEGSDLSGIAVLYRAHSHSLDIQVALTRAGIPFMVRSGVRFFEQAHIKDVLSLLRFIWNPSDEIALSRLLKLFPGIGNATASAAAAEMGGAAASMPGRILDEGYRPASIKGSRAAVGWDLFRRTLSAVLKPGGTAGPSPVIDEFVKEHYREAAGSRYPNAEERLEDIEQLSAFSSRHGEIGAFLREISLLTNIDVDRPSNPAAERSGMVTLSSVHQAKGLEWRAVFVVWLCDGRFPSSLALKDPAGEEEERRLFYVAITRAKDDLYLCQPLSEAGRDRMIKLMRPSRFISEIGDLGGLAERWNLEPAGRAERS